MFCELIWLSSTCTLLQLKINQQYEIYHTIFNTVISEGFFTIYNILVTFDGNSFNPPKEFRIDFRRFTTHLLFETGPIYSSICSRGNILLQCNYGRFFSRQITFKMYFIFTNLKPFGNSGQLCFKPDLFSILRLNVRW